MIAQESLRLRDSDFSEDAILQCAKQILFKCSGADVRLVMIKLIESHNDLSGLIEIVKSHLDKEKEMFEIGMFLKILDLFDLSDNQTLEIGSPPRTFNF